MTDHPLADPNLNAFQAELREVFGAPMHSALKIGLARGLTREEIGVATVVALMRCAGLAIVGAQLNAGDFAGALDQAVEGLRTQVRKLDGRLH